MGDENGDSTEEDVVTGVRRGNSKKERLERLAESSRGISKGTISYS